MELSPHQIHLIELLSTLLLFFGISGLIVPLLQRLKLSPILGYLICGILVGPNGLALFIEQMPALRFVTVDDPSTVQILGELGIIALLFMIGLEFSIGRLVELKRYVLGLGSAQIIVSAAVIAGVALLFNNSLPTALLLGASLALSSTAIVMQMLSEKHMINRPIGILSFSILLMQDLAVVPILIMASVISGSSDQSLLWVVVNSLAIAVAVIVAIYIIGKRFLRPLMEAIPFTHSPEWLMAFVLFIVIATATLTQSAGLSAALGAFLAGLLISETQFRFEVEVIIEPLKNLLLGIFFLSVGMMIDWRAVMDNPLWIVVSVIGIFMIKAAILYPLARLFGVVPGMAGRMAVMLSQPGEFAFMILGFAMTTQVLPPEHGQFFLLVTAIAMFLSPLLFRLAPVIGKALDKECLNQLKELENTPEKEGHVIIAGFGRIGMMVGCALEKQMIPYIAIDHDPQQVDTHRARGFNVMYGDVKHKEQWYKLKADKAKAVVIAIDEEQAAKEALHTVKKHWPHLPVMMRSKDTSSAKDLYTKGAILVVPEALESSLQLARATMETYGVAEEELDDIIYQSRKHVAENVE